VTYLDCARFDFLERLDELSEELRVLNSEAHRLEGQIERNLEALRDAASQVDKSGMPGIEIAG